MQKRQTLLFITGVNGGGKSTLAKNFPEYVSTTTRERRVTDKKEELEGIDYYYVPKEEFDKREMAEIIEHGGQSYGLEVAEMVKLQNEDVVALVVAPKGIVQVQAYIEENNLPIDTKIIAMMPSRKKIMENLRKEGVPEDEIEKRCQRGTLPEDLIELGLLVDLVVSVLDKKTTQMVKSWVEAETKYTLKCNDMVDEVCSEERVIDYAKSRLSCNPRDLVPHLSPLQRKSFIKDENLSVDELLSYLDDDSSDEAKYDGYSLEESLQNVLRTWDMNLKQAIEITQSYGEEVVSNKHGKMMDETSMAIERNIAQRKANGLSSGGL